MMRSVLADAVSSPVETTELPIFDSSKPARGCEVYMAKFVSSVTGHRVHLYNRSYRLLGHLTRIGDWKEIAMHPGRTDSWSGYTGGSDEVKGLAVWLDLSEKAKSEFDRVVRGAEFGTAAGVFRKGASRG